MIPALYLADSESTAWAEWYRHLAETAVPPSRAVPRDLWRYRVSVEHVADLTHPKQFARLGLDSPRPDGRQWRPYQEVGERLFQRGWRGLLAPSAARPDGCVLCVFWPDHEIPGVRPVPPPARIEEPPPVPRGTADLT